MTKHLNCIWDIWRGWFITTQPSACISILLHPPMHQAGRTYCNIASLHTMGWDKLWCNSTHSSCQKGEQSISGRLTALKLEKRFLNIWQLKYSAPFLLNCRLIGPHLLDETLHEPATLFPVYSLQPGAIHIYSGYSCMYPPPRKALFTMKKHLIFCAVSSVHASKVCTMYIVHLSLENL